VSDAAPEKTGDTATPAKKPSPSGVVKGTRRPMPRKPAVTADGTPATPPAPAKPDQMKVVALAVCAALFVACVGVGAYILFFKKAPVKTVKLSEDAKALADKAERAKALYAEGKAKAGSDKLEDLTEAADKMFQALNLFNEVADEYKTVPGHEEAIREAHDRKLFIDAELKKVRDKKYELETQADKERREKAKASEPKKPTEAAVAPPAPTQAGKEPTEEELSDKNLDRLFNDDPSEYERLAKIREKKDPNFKMKKP